MAPMKSNSPWMKIVLAMIGLCLGAGMACHEKETQPQASPRPKVGATAVKEGLTIEGRCGGEFKTNNYVLTDQATGAWAIVDPSDQVSKTWADHMKNVPPPKAIYITHGHFDHTIGIGVILKHYPGTPVWIHPEGKALLADKAPRGTPFSILVSFIPAKATNFYKEGDVLELGHSRITVLDAPGHCRGSVLLKCGNRLIVGDVLFKGRAGRWDLPGADYEALTRTICQKIMTLPDDTEVYPGHGEKTTIGAERASNEIVQRMLKRTLKGEKPES